MNLKSIVQMEVKVGEEVVSLQLPAGVPYGAAYDAVFQMLDHIIKMSQEAAEKAERIKDDEEKEEGKQVE